MLGTLYEEYDANGVITVKGRLATYSLNLNFILEANPNRFDDNSPTHLVMGKGVHGALFQAGIAWRGKTKDGSGMYSLLLSIPEIWKEEQEFVAFSRKDGSFVIQPSKPKETSVQAEAA